MALSNATPASPADNLTRLGLNGQSTVLIVGLGKTGLSVARCLAGHGIPFAVTDTRETPPCLDALARECPDAALFLGGFREDAFATATHLVPSPGVSLHEPLIREARARGASIFGDLDLFAVQARAPVVAITGSNGKSTVTTLVGLMAEADGKHVRVGGNLGTPMLELLDSTAELYVLELSSFQLESSHELDPFVATVLNVSADHMDRYPDFDAYARAKERIFRGNGRMVLNRDDPTVARMARPDRTTVWFSLQEPADYMLCGERDSEWLTAAGEPLMPRERVGLQGRHNMANALAAMALADAAGVSRAAQARVLTSFSGLDHRMQWVAEFDRVEWINDSKATNVGACMAALSGMDRPVVLIAGGDGKGADFNELRPVVAAKVKALVLMGKDAPAMESALGDLAPTVRAKDMRQAVAAARRLSCPGDTVMLAPACASLDQYRDYQQRGQMFADEVRRLAP